MAASVPAFPTKFQEITIASNINCSMIQNFLVGVYTVVYGVTVHVYLSRKQGSTGKHVVLASVTALYLFSVINFGVQWYGFNWSLIVHGDTRTSVFLVSVTGLSTVFSTLINLTYSLSWLVADVLLIWRCYHVWGRSFKIISVLCLLFLCEIALTIAVTVVDVLFQTFTTPAQAESLNSLTIVFAFISLAITATATSLIGYRIYSTSKGNTIMQAKKRYTRIIILIVESSAVYSLLLLLFGIVLAVPAFNQIDSSVGPLGAYLQTFLTATPGLVPTVMVARLAFQDENTDYETSHMSVDVSNLNFDNRQAGHETSSPHETDFALNPTTHNETENSPAENLQDNITHEKRSD